MKTSADQTATNPPVGRVYEDGLSTEELRELVSSPSASKIAGTADEVCDRVIDRIKAKKHAQ